MVAALPFLELTLMLLGAQVVAAYTPVTEYLVSYQTSMDNDVVLLTAAPPPSITAFSSTTSIYAALNVPVVQYYFSGSAIPQPWPTETTPTGTAPRIYTQFFEISLQKAPPFCSPTSWKYTTSTRVSPPPSALIDQLVPLWTRTKSATATYGSLQTPLTVFELVFPLHMFGVPSTTYTPTPVPSTHPDYARYCNHPEGLAMVPLATATARGDSELPGSESGDGNSDSDPHVGNMLWYGQPIDLDGLIITICILIGILFIMGFMENFFWFRQLMIGQPALRFGTVSWTFLTCGAGICITRRSKARRPSARRELMRRWEALSAEQKWTLWWQWGFKWSYPEELLGKEDGPVPMAAPIQEYED